jgi:hypothetical protein
MKDHAVPLWPTKRRRLKPPSLSGDEGWCILGKSPPTATKKCQRAVCFCAAQ